MKLVSLNIWAGREFDALIDYVSSRADSTDIFCFQEVFHTPTNNKIVDEHYRANIFSELQNILPNHNGYFASALNGCGFNKPAGYKISWGLAMFLRKGLKPTKVGSFGIYIGKKEWEGDSANRPRNLQYARIKVNDDNLTIAHFHGLWTPSGKIDNEDRIKQSAKVKEFLDNNQGKKIVCGDFNLLPDTRSLSILEKGFVNLIKANNIKTTRSSLYSKPERYADYTLITPDIKVKSFSVPNVNASDHLPMELEFT